MSGGANAKVAALLAALGGDDNAKRSAAEAHLTAAVKGPAFVVALLKYIDCNATRSGDDGTVALAAVLLSRHVSEIWNEFTRPQKQQIFSHILRQFAGYQSPTVLQCLAELANTVAQVAAGEDNYLWDDLVRLALQCSQRRTGGGAVNVLLPARREVSFKLLGMLVESLGGRIAATAVDGSGGFGAGSTGAGAGGYYGGIMKAVLGALAADPVPQVRAAALTSASVALGASDCWAEQALPLLPKYFDYCLLYTSPSPRDRG